MEEKRWDLLWQGAKGFNVFSAGTLEHLHSLSMKASEPLELIELGMYNITRHDFRAYRSEAITFAVKAKVNVAKALRSMTGLSQARFAEKYEIPKRTIENWENETSQATLYLLKLLARAVDEDLYK